MEKKKILGLARKKKTTTRKKSTTTKKKTTPPPKTQSAISKAKEKVEDLLKDVSLDLQKKENNPKPQNKESIEWLEEQVGLLSKEREKLRKELVRVKDDYDKIFNENQRLKTNSSTSESNNIELKVITLFNKIQTNYFNIPNLVLPGRAFMLEMIQFFPFLKKEKRKW